MGLTKSYQTFMASRAIRGAFSAFESESLDDAQEFSSLFRRDEARGLITVVKEDHGQTVVISKMEKSMDALKATDDRSKAVQKTPWRVSLDGMKKQVVSVEYLYPASIPHMTIAVVVLKNGYALQGMSAPADPANFDEALGREYAYENAMKELWPLEAYVMRDYLSGLVEIHDPNGRWNPTE